MGKKIRSATKRAIPRPFSFEWGKGQVIEEASIRVQMQNHSWEPAIEVVMFDDGLEMVRFCVVDGKQFSRMPLLIMPDELVAVFEEASKHSRIRMELNSSGDRLGR